MESKERMKIGNNDEPIRIIHVVSILLMLSLLLVSTVGAISGNYVNRIRAIMAALLLVLNLGRMQKTFRFAAWSFTLIGIAGLIYGHAGGNQWVEGFTSMLSTAVILIAVQFLAFAIWCGEYEKNVRAALKNITAKPAILYILIMVLTHVLSGVMSLGAVPVVIAAILPAVEGRIRHARRFIASAICCGYCTLFIWAPSSLTALIGTQIFHVDWQSYCFPALGFAILGMLLAGGYALIVYRRADEMKAGSEKEGNFINNGNVEKPDWMRIFHIAAALISIAVLIMIMEKLHFSDNFGRMLLSILLAALVWIATQNGKNKDREGRKLWWERTLLGNTDLVIFFISMGLFSAGLQAAHVPEILTVIFSGYIKIPDAGFLVLMPLIIILLSMIGIHPFVSMMVVGPLIADMGLGIAPLKLALAICLGGCEAYMLSPFSGVILTLSSELQIPVMKIGFVNNIKITAAFFVLSECLLCIL